jgi:hypothetical protein
MERTITGSAGAEPQVASSSRRSSSWAQSLNRSPLIFAGGPVNQAGYRVRGAGGGHREAQEELGDVRKAVSDACDDVAKKLKAASLSERTVASFMAATINNINGRLDVLSSRLEEQQQEQADLGPVKESLEVIKAQLQEQAKAAGRDQEALKAVLGGLGTVLGSVDAKLDGVVVGISHLSEYLDMGLAGLLPEMQGGDGGVKGACGHLARAVGELQARATLSEQAGGGECLAVLEEGKRPVVQALQRLHAASPEPRRQRLEDAIARLEQR